MQVGGLSQLFVFSLFRLDLLLQQALKTKKAKLNQAGEKLTWYCLHVQLVMLIARLYG
jgi:hypothetical protein